MGDTNTPMCVSFKDYQTGMRKLFEQGDHSDVTLVCSDGKSFKAHKAILCAHSEFFSKAFQSNKFLEGHTNRVDLEVGDSEIIAQLLKYLYTLEYDISTAETGANSTWLNAKSYAAADFYVIPSLKKVSRANFEQSAAKLCSLSDSKEGLSELPAIIWFIYENTIDEAGLDLRETAVKVIISHAAKFFESDENIDCLQSMMKKSGTFERDISIAMLRKWQDFRKVNCNQCGHVWADPRLNDFSLCCPKCNVRKYDWADYEVD